MPCLQISNLLLPESLIAPACCFVLSADRVSKPKRHPTYSVENLIIQKVKLAQLKSHHLIRITPSSSVHYMQRVRHPVDCLPCLLPG
ncbi:hypothetical protein B0T24DRAFT_637413 [Lasiosphaeria ovina]|uniref:Uncharacterized protein n=1 Tax=Lasiosphaeria ovina TaxID=92902 RepID=A0AAE0JX33_9PEZI|nr:hypothetical protein B0T24DRAFT_637413 [Lasiosphaeria ovina]